MRRLNQTAGPVALYIAVLAAPLLFLVGLWAFTDDDLDELNVTPEPVVLPVTEREVRDRQNAQLSFEWEPGLPLRAPAWQGTVTAVFVQPDHTIRPGDRVLAIDGVDRVAIRSAAPFHRPLSSGQTAAEVAMLYELMTALGYFEGEPANPQFYAFALSLAVREFEADLGVSPLTGNFDPGLVIWMPRDEMTLGRVDIDIGAPAPSPGSVIAEEAPRLITASLRSVNPSERLSFAPGVEYIAFVRDEPFRVDSEAHTIVADALAALADLVSPADENVPAPVEREAVLQVVAAPATSVVSNSRGDLCVWVAGGNGYEARRVVTGTSRAGVTNILDGLDLADRVLANPAEVLEQPGCP